MNRAIGTVTATLEARATLRVRGPALVVEVDCLIDTGFNGFLVLPSTVIKDLGLPMFNPAAVELADGSLVMLRRYAARAGWDNASTEVLVLEAEGDSLVGMAFLDGSRLTIDIQPGGAVTIE